MQKGKNTSKKMKKRMDGKMNHMKMVAMTLGAMDVAMGKKKKRK